MQRTFRILVGVAIIGIMATVLFCHSSETPAATEKDFRIWSEGTASPPAVPSGFNPGAGFAPLVQKVKPAVVNVYSTAAPRAVRRSVPRSPLEDFFGERRRSNALGSGFVINDQGFVLTNNHVVAQADAISVKTDDGREYKAKIIGRDEKYDLALLKVEPEAKLPFVVFGDSDALAVGDWVIAIGNPFGLAHTVTAGIVSAKDRVIGAGPFDDFIQTDASINPGNSGGPLFDAQGRVVGINTAIHAAGQGIGFAVPVNMAKTFIRDVLTKGRVTRGWLGVALQDLTPELARGLGLSTARGVVVSQVVPGSPAEKAGLQRGDVIKTFDGKPIETGTILTRLVGMTSPGESRSVTVLRNGTEKTLTVVIADRETGDVEGEGTRGSEDAPSLGLKVGKLPPAEADRLRLKAGQGVVVTDVDDEGPAAEAELRPGDIIIEVNRSPVSSPEEFWTATARVKPGDSMLILVVRGQNYFYVVLQRP